MKPSTWWTLKSAITCARVRRLCGPKILLAMLLFLPRLRQQRVDILPEFLPGVAFVLREFRQRLGIAHAGEVGVFLPVGHLGLHHGPVLVGVLVELFAPGGEIG